MAGAGVNLAEALPLASGPLPVAIMAVPERRDRVVSLVQKLVDQGLSPVVVWDHDHRGPWWTNQVAWDVVTNACGPDQWGMVMEDDVKLASNFAARVLTFLAALDGTEPVTFFGKRPECGRSPNGVYQRKPFVRMKGRHFTGTLAMAMTKRVALEGLAWIRAKQDANDVPEHWLYHGDERWRSFFWSRFFIVSTPSLVNHDDGGVSIANPHWNGQPRRGAVWFEG